MDLLETIQATYAVIGQEMSDIGLEVLTQELSGYPLADVLKALGRCRRELKRLTLSDILDRLPNGHPGPEEAWAIVGPTLKNGEETIIWSEEMREAFGVAWCLRDDLVAARMAFKEHYAKAINLAREAQQPPKWCVSLGDNKACRELVLTQGLEQGRLSYEYVMLFLSDPTDPEAIAILERHAPRLLS